MLETFIPLVTKEVGTSINVLYTCFLLSLFQTLLVMIPVLTSFLPPSHTHLYLPALFKLWEAFNSSVMDDRLLELAGDLAEEHVASVDGVFGSEGGAKWKEVGIWSEEQWNLLVGKGLASMSMLSQDL